jgi:hypothetical protein
MTGSVKNSFGGLLREVRHYAHKYMHEVLVDLLYMQRELHPAVFTVMDGTVAGDGAGPRTMIPRVKNLILAASDSVAIDAIAARLASPECYQRSGARQTHGTDSPTGFCSGRCHLERGGLIMSKRPELARATLRETIDECGVPALGAVLVRDEGDMTVSAQQGIRKVGEKGEQNKIQPHDRFNLGSVSKVFTGNLMGKLIQEGIGGLQWTTKLVDVFPDLPLFPLMKKVYKNVTIQQFLVHTSGMRKAPVGDNNDEYVVTVSEAEIAAAVRLAAEEARLVVEPSGALPIAAMRFHAREAGLVGLDGPIVGVVSGGNVDPDRYVAYLEAPIPHEA